MAQAPPGPSASHGHVAEPEPEAPEEAPASEAPGDRRVVLIIGALVLGLLAASVISALVPGMDATLAAAPLVIAVLVLGTAFVLVRSLRRRDD